MKEKNATMALNFSALAIFFVLLIHDKLCLQECQDHHAAKDGDGWVEQSGQSFFFGIFQKVCPF